MIEKTYHVPNISCGHCVHTIKMELSDLENVISVSADETTKMVSVKFEDAETESTVMNLLEEIGYPVASES